MPTKLSTVEESLQDGWVLRSSYLRGLDNNIVEMFVFRQSSCHLILILIPLNIETCVLQ